MPASSSSFHNRFQVPDVPAFQLPEYLVNIFTFSAIILTMPRSDACSNQDVLIRRSQDVTNLVCCDIYDFFGSCMITMCEIQFDEVGG